MALCANSFQTESVFTHHIEDRYKANMLVSNNNENTTVLSSLKCAICATSYSVNGQGEVR